MSNGQKDAHAAAFHISQMLGPFLAKDFASWLEADPDRLTRASRLLTIRSRDKDNELQLRVTDLFRHDHLGFAEISTAAGERAVEHENERAHLKTCSVCNAFVETEAARIILRRGMSVSLTGLDAKVPEAPTDNQKWFGRTSDSRL